MNNTLNFEVGYGVTLKWYISVKRLWILPSTFIVRYSVTLKYKLLSEIGSYPQLGSIQLYYPEVGNFIQRIINFYYQLCY